MGGGGSNLLAGTDKAGSKQETVASYHLIGLKNHEVKQLKRVFQKLDVMKKGSLDLRAIYSYFCLEDNVYMTHIFHRVQREDAKEIYAQEFVLCASYFLMLSRDALIEFFIEAYDSNKDHLITRKSLQEMLKAAYGQQCESNLRAIYIEIYPNDDFNAQYSMNLKFNVINMNAIIKKHIHIIQPLMQLQENLKEKIMGRKFWDTRDPRLLSKPEVKALYTNRYAAGYGRSRLGNEASLRSKRDATIRRDPQKPGKSMDSGDRAPSVSRIDKVTIRRDPQKHGKSMDSGDRAPSVNRIDNRRSKEH